MKVVSIVLDNIVYIIGDADLDFMIFDTAEEFFEFLESLSESKFPASSAKAIFDELNKGGPRLHGLETVELDVVEGESSAILIAPPDCSSALSLIQCSGVGAEKWRSSGVSIKMEETGVSMEFESPRLKTLKNIQEPIGGIH